eukprot:7357824-Pyramimonas_sp.AAC.1
MGPFRASVLNLSGLCAEPTLARFGHHIGSFSPSPFITLFLHQSRFHSIPLSIYLSIPSAAPVAAAADVDVAADALAADPGALSEHAAPAADVGAAAPAPDAGA